MDGAFADARLAVQSGCAAPMPLYQETPYFAAILRAFASWLSPLRFATRFFAGLEGEAAGVASGAAACGAGEARGTGAAGAASAGAGVD
jgi:hypothetical protein